ncbi:MAG: YCF48-related protein [Terriglobales bacterium]
MRARWVGVFCTLLIMALPLHGATSAFGGGPAGGNIRTLAIDPSNPSVIYAGTAVFENYFEHNKNGGGVFKTTDGGQSWTAASNGLPDDPVQALAVDPNNPGTAYAGTMDQGIFKTVDGGQSWNSANTGLSDNFIFVIALDPSNPSTLYAGTTGAAGFFKSTNAGQSWAPVNLGFPGIRVTSLTFDPTNAKIIYAGTTTIDSATTGLFKSTDGGQSWILTNAGLIEPPLGRGVVITGIAVDPTNPTVLYVAGGAAGSAFKSIDSGQSWTLIALRLGSSILVDPSRPATLYAAGIFGSFKSTDGGASWVATNAGLTDTGIQALVLNPASPSTLYLGTSSDGAFKSIDGGQSWSMANTGITARSVGALAVDPSNSATLYAGSVMSLFKTTDGGATWSVIDNGIDPALKLSTTFGFLALTVDPTDSNNVYAGGTIPTTLLKSANAGQFWAPLNEPFLVNVSAVVVDPTLPSTVYAGSTVNGVLKSPDGGQTWALTPLTFSQGKTVTSLALDPSTPATLYAGSFGIGGGVYKTTDGAQSWAQALSSSIMSVTVNPLTTGVVYAGSATGDIYKTADSGQTWTLVQTGITDASGNPVTVRTLAMDPAIPTTIYAGTFGAGVFKSVDGGQSWSAINTGLPNLRILRLVVDPASPSTIYAATLGAGVFKSTNGGQNWQGTEPPPGTGTPAITVSPTQINFLPTPLNTTSAPVTVVVNNPGTAALLISDISTQNPFFIINPSSNIGNIAPNTSGTFDVVFSPTGAGPYSGAVSITSNAPSSPTTIPLQGTVITTGTINVNTNTPSATFTVMGPITYFGSGQAATFPNAPAGTYKITYGPDCRSDLPPMETKSLQAGTTINFNGNYLPGFLSVFPLVNQNACNAKMNSVFDHTPQYPYCADNKVMAYTGEKGDQPRSSFVLSAFCSTTQDDNDLYGLTQAGGGSFSLHGQYLGAGTPQFLFYDGHPGYDYQASCHDPVLAAVPGTIHYPSSIPGLGVNGGKKYHILEIIPDSPNQSYRVIYLHLSTYPTKYCPSCSCATQPAVVSEGQHVNPGDPIGTVGNAGTPRPHLHFEIQLLGLPSNPAGVPVDPYGWQGFDGDPYSPRAINVNLWK